MLCEQTKTGEDGVLTEYLPATAGGEGQGRRKKTGSRAQRLPDRQLLHG